MSQFFDITQFHNLSTFLPILFFVTLWVGFPVWLSLRRAQGLIKIEKTNQDGEMVPVGIYLELGVFFIAIPFTLVFFILMLNMLLLPFIADSSVRGQHSIQGACLLMVIALILYIYKVERKIYLRALNGKDETGG